MRAGGDIAQQAVPAARRAAVAAAPFLRLLVDGPAGGAWNMAVDEALLEGWAGNGVTMRLYRWSRPTVSLGYAQCFERGFDGAESIRQSIAVVRRPTGGRAVLHADELTYSLVGGTDSGPLAGGVQASYRVVAGGLSVGLRALGAGVGVERSKVGPHGDRGGACFAARARYEFVADGRKLLGSAQRRRGGMLLQHGSLLLGAPDRLRWKALGPGYEAAAAASIGLIEVLGWRPTPRMLAATLAHGVGEALSLPVRRGVLSRQERRRAATLRRKYESEEWTRRR